MVAGTHLFYVVLYLTLKFVLQTGAMSVYLVNYAKFELLMTPSQHEECFFSYRKEGVKHPDKVAYAHFFNRIWDNGMEVDAEGKRRWGEFLRLSISSKRIGFLGYQTIFMTC